MLYLWEQKTKWHSEIHRIHDTNAIKISNYWTGSEFLQEPGTRILSYFMPFGWILNSSRWTKSLPQWRNLPLSSVGPRGGTTSLFCCNNSEPLSVISLTSLTWKLFIALHVHPEEVHWRNAKAALSSSRQEGGTKTRVISNFKALLISTAKTICLLFKSSSQFDLHHLLVPRWHIRENKGGFGQWQENIK